MPNPTNTIALRLSLLLREFPLATDRPDVIEISLSTFLIACVASYQKCAQWYFYHIGVFCCQGEFPWRQQESQRDCVSEIGPRPYTTNVIALLLLLLLREFPLTTEEPDVIEISFCSFLITCNTNYLNKISITSGLIYCRGKLSQQQHHSQHNRVSWMGPWFTPITVWISVMIKHMPDLPWAAVL